MSVQKPDVEYRPIPGHLGYAIGSDGTVWSRWKSGWRANLTLSNWRPIKLCKGWGGYPTVTLNRKRWRVHRLVLETFVGPCPPGMESRHLDGNRLNNRLDNLKYGTDAENAADSRQHGTHRVGSQMPTAKLTEDVVEFMRVVREEVGFSYQEIADMVGVGRETARRIIKRVRWRHVA